MRAGSVPQTPRNYTGQRLDGTGLLYYNARMDDPVLGRFVSADSIIPDDSNPQTLNRYSYTLNNPVNYVDPSGHCGMHANDEDDMEECKRVKQELWDSYHIIITSLSDWRLIYLKLIDSAISDLREKAGWSMEMFRETMGIMYFNRNVNDSVYAAKTYTIGVDFVTFFDSAFTNENARDTFLSDDDQLTFKAMIVHELAHVMDGLEFDYSRRMERITGSYMNNRERAITDYGRKTWYEDWAESFAATVYPNAPRYRTGEPLEKRREAYVLRVMKSRVTYYQNRYGR